MGIHVCLMFVMGGGVIDYIMSCDRMMCHCVSWCVECHVYTYQTHLQPGLLQHFHWVDHFGNGSLHATTPW